MRGMRLRVQRRRALVLASALLVLTITALLLARTHVVAANGGSVQTTSGIIDGANDPAAIPDPIAFSIVFDVLAGHDTHPLRARSA